MERKFRLGKFEITVSRGDTEAAPQVGERRARLIVEFASKLADKSFAHSAQEDPSELKIGGGLEIDPKIVIGIQQAAEEYWPPEPEGTSPKAQGNGMFDGIPFHR